jgi:RNA polymerase sigma-70 factor (ECF subfamily)
MKRGKQVRDDEATALPPDRVSALESLYRQYSGWLGRRLSVRFRRAAVEVDDIVQEAYLRAARYAPEEAGRHPKALLMRIAVNLARDHMRRNVVRGGLSLDDDGMPPVSVPGDQHEMALLKDAILSLPPLYRDVFVLSRFTGLTYEEIASHEGISVKAVEWRMSKAIAMCVDRLQD